jgi:hypothetical protein
MTPTQLEVTEEQYNSGSSAICDECKARNYFLVDLINVSYQWNCVKCGVDNFHPLHQEARNKIGQLKEQLQKLKNDLDLSIVLSNDGPRYNHPPAEQPKKPTLAELAERFKKLGQQQ